VTFVLDELVDDDFNSQQIIFISNFYIQVERKRARNRIAASKCRMRKLERIAVLDQQAGQLRANNDELKSLTEKLRAEVFELQQVLKDKPILLLFHY